MSKPRSTKTTGKKGRKRCAAGWALLTLGVLVAGTWVTSRGWHMRRFVTRDGAVDVKQGILTVEAWVTEDGAMLLYPDNISTIAMAHRDARPPHLRRLPLDDRGFAWFICRRSSGYRHTQWNLGVIDNRESILPTMREWRLVLWPIPLLLWTPAVLLLRSGITANRRAIKGACATCGYNLTGLAADAKCPECGKDVGGPPA